MKKTHAKVSSKKGYVKAQMRAVKVEVENVLATGSPTTPPTPKASSGSSSSTGSGSFQGLTNFTSGGSVFSSID